MKVSAPKEDPAVAAAAAEEQQRADTALVGNTQQLLDEDDRDRLRRLGALQFGGTSGFNYATSGGVPVSGGGGSGGSGAPSAFVGTAGGGGGSCPAPETPVLLADGSEVLAGDIRVGMVVRTQHDTTLRWMDTRVYAVMRDEGERWKLTTDDGREIIATFNHRMFVTGEGWTELRDLRPGDPLDGELPGIVESCAFHDVGEVVKISVAVAQTYQTCRLLSHNAKGAGL